MKSNNRLFSPLLIIAFVISSLAQLPVSTNTPSAARLRTHIEYLASDKLEGRRTGTAGATLAAEYIAREFSRYGLRRSIGYDTAGMSILEANSPNRYLQKFPYVGGVELGKSNELKINLVSGNAPETQGSFKTESSKTLIAGEDWMPLGFSSNSHIENGQAVYAGYGIVAADLKRDDYAGLDVKGKLVVALAGTPDKDNPHGQFARYQDPRWKVAAAKDKGASGLVLLSEEEKFSDERLSRLRYDNAGEAGLPVIILAKPAAMLLLKELALQLFDDNGTGNCGPGTKMADGTIVSPCTKFKLIVYPDGKREVELLDGSRGELQPDGTFKMNKFFGPEKLEKFSWTVTTDIVRSEVPAANVVGILDGSDPVLKKEVVVIGAHYDHLGHGGEGSLAPKEGEIHHGADDNASGSAGLLELARIFSAQHPRPRRTLVFIAFSGEEEGLLGSNYYVNHPIVPLADTVAMVNMDMIGRLKEKKLVVGGVGTAKEWRGLLDSANLELTPSIVGSGPTRSGAVLPSRSVSPVQVVLGTSDGTPTQNARLPQFELMLNEDGFGPSDHSSFYGKQIPVLFFWTGTHEDYHKPSDTAEKINYEGEARIVALVANLISNIDITDARPTYAVAKSESTGRSAGFRVYLGTIPIYADSTDGLTLDGVRDDSPAAKAGIKAGDKIIKLAGREVRNVYDYTYALGEMKAGQEYEVELLRGGERMKLRITPTARK